eukprot:7241144-Ditylum_brightwellii.AAC.1
MGELISLEEERDEELNDDIALIWSVKSNITDKEHKKWKEISSSTPRDFVDLVESIEDLVKLIVLFAVSIETNQSKREEVMDNVNVHLTSLEDYVGRDYQEAVRDIYPNVSIAIRDMLTQLKEHTSSVEKTMQTVVGCIKEVELIAIEANERAKRQQNRTERQEETLNNDFMFMTGLGGHGEDSPHERTPTGDHLELLNDKVTRLDKTIKHVADMLGAIKSQSGSEDIVVILRGDIFKGEADVRSWAESNLPSNYPIELVLLGHTNVQAATMECNQKLSLEVDEALHPPRTLDSQESHVLANGRLQIGWE